MKNSGTPANNDASSQTKGRGGGVILSKRSVSRDGESTNHSQGRAWGGGGRLC